MPRGDKSSYTGKQKRQAEHIEEGYEHRSVPEGEAARRAWATVNKETGGGRRAGVAVERRPATPRRAKAANLAVLLRRSVLPVRGLHQQKRPPPRGSVRLHTGRRHSKHGNVTSETVPL